MHITHYNALAWIQAAAITVGSVVCLGAATSNGNLSTPPVASIDRSALTEAERDGLILMRQEEKLARDVYAKLHAKWNVRPFQNIGSSETRHMEAVRGLLERYGMEDPVAGMAPGEFASTDMTALYEALVTKGEASLESALQVGLEIEDLDIYDLQEALKSVKQDDIRVVYENLMRGSRNHLRAFSANLAARGGTYVPQHLSQEQFDKIAAGDHERGPAQGRGGRGPASRGRGAGARRRGGAR